jgi:hypothetical protein
MHKVTMLLVLVLFLATTVVVRAQAVPSSVNLRYSEQVSNGSAGTCGCFGLEGIAGDAGWRLKGLGIVGFGLAADAGVVHTGSEGGAPYGLTLTTLTAGPRFNLPRRKLQTFAEALFGFAHGSGSAFPHGNTLVSSANSFALDVGGALDYSLQKRFSVRLLQVDYLRTSLPNSSTDWQNNLRIGIGITLHLKSSTTF